MSARVVPGTMKPSRSPQLTRRELLFKALGTAAALAGAAVRCAGPTQLDCPPEPVNNANKIILDPKWLVLEALNGATANLVIAEGARALQLTAQDKINPGVVIFPAQSYEWAPHCSAVIKGISFEVKGAVAPTARGLTATLFPPDPRISYCKTNIPITEHWSAHEVSIPDPEQRDITIASIQLIVPDIVYNANIQFGNFSLI